MTAAVHADTGETIEITGTHPVADLFPLLDDEDMEALAADIAANGLAQAVILDPDGQLLDGRNRITACDRAGVKPTCSTYHGPDPVGHILALNNNRRHISKGQRAMVAATALLGTNNQGDAALAAGVAQAYIAKAATVLEHAKELADEVRLGALPLDKAYDRARDNKQREQSEAQRRKEAETAKKKRLTRLRTDHDDLADKVDAGGMVLAEAEAVAKQRAEDYKIRRREYSRLLADMLYAVQAMTKGDIRESLTGFFNADDVQGRDVGDHKRWLTANGIRELSGRLNTLADEVEQMEGASL